MKYIEDKKVGELMTCGVITVQDHEKVINVIKILSEGHIHGAVVVGKECKAIGMISEIDIPKAFGRDLEEVTAAEIMSKPIKTINRNATVADAAKIMQENGFDRLVVLAKEGFPRGIISVTDIIREITDSYFT